MSFYSYAANLPPWAYNMAGAMPAIGANMAGALPAIGLNMAGSLPAIGSNMAGALPAIGSNMAGSLPAVGSNMAGALPAIGANMAGALPAIGANMAAHLPQTGAGGASGTGFLGGYGPQARLEYATPASLGPVPWALDFTYDGGWGPFQFEQWTDPTTCKPSPTFSVQDWDPALRFWTLKFDHRLTEWLQDVNLAAPSVMVAREYAAQHEYWACTEGDKGSPLQECLDQHRDEVLKWNNPDPRIASPAWTHDIVALQDLMRDDRERYVWEAQAQSQSLSVFFTHFIAMDPATKPWTVEWLNCAAAISNLTKMHYKAHYKRVRPSVLCPGLVPPWGPPLHPAFPSGHSLVSHMMAVFLMQIPHLAVRFGIRDPDQSLGRAPKWSDFTGIPYGQEMNCPLLWLAWRIARNRERIGVHYPSDSAAGRLLAGGLAHLLFGVDEVSGKRNMGEAAETTPSKASPPTFIGGALKLPSLRSVLEKAKAEWPEAWMATASSTS